MYRSNHTNAGFVYQEDLFIPTMTVKEHLTFHAMVRMDANIPGAQPRASMHGHNTASVPFCIRIRIHTLNITLHNTRQNS